MSASTALVVSAIAGVVLGMAFVKMPQPMTADLQGQQAPVRTTSPRPDPLVPPSPPQPPTSRLPRPSSTTSAPTATTTPTTTTSTTTTRPTKTSKPKPPKPTT